MDTLPLKAPYTTKRKLGTNTDSNVDVHSPWVRPKLASRGFVNRCKSHQTLPDLTAHVDRALVEGGNR